MLKRLAFLPFCISFLSACASVDQAMYSVSDAVSSVDRVTGQRSVNLASRQSQIQKSNAQIEALLDQARAEGIPLNEEVDKEGYVRLLRIFERVHSVSHLKDEKWTVVLIPEESFNAFVNGGTYVVVHKGLLDKVESDDEIAALLGHELAHVAANHIYEMHSHITIASLKGSKSAKRDTFHSAFTHENEEEADEIGILYAALAGYDPYAASRLWKRMYENEGDFTRVVITHPIKSERYKRSEELARIYKRYHFVGEINPKPDEALRNNPVFGREPEDMSAPAPGEGGGFLALLEVVADGLEKHYEAKGEEYRQRAQVAKVQYVESSLDIQAIEPLSDNHTLVVTATYRGYEQLNNLTLVGISGDEKATKRISYPINPGDRFQFDLEFRKNVNAINRDGLGIVVSHVD